MAGSPRARADAGHLPDGGLGYRRGSSRKGSPAGRRGGSDRESLAPLVVLRPSAEGRGRRSTGSRGSRSWPLARSGCSSGPPPRRPRSGPAAPPSWTASSALLKEVFDGISAVGDGGPGPQSAEFKARYPTFFSAVPASAASRPASVPSMIAPRGSTPVVAARRRPRAVLRRARRGARVLPARGRRASRGDDRGPARPRGRARGTRRRWRPSSGPCTRSRARRTRSAARRWATSPIRSRTSSDAVREHRLDLTPAVTEAMFAGAAAIKRVLQSGARSPTRSRRPWSGRPATCARSARRRPCTSARSTAARGRGVRARGVRGPGARASRVRGAAGLRPAGVPGSARGAAAAGPPRRDARRPAPASAWPSSGSIP